MKHESLIDRVRNLIEERQLLPSAASPPETEPAPARPPEQPPICPPEQTPTSEQTSEQPPAPACPVVLMVSGGSDSVALMRLLPLLHPQHSYTVLHINHMLRGKDADEDECFVLDLAQACGLPAESRRVDVGFLAAKSGGNLEEVGREQRYLAANELLDRLCAQAGCTPEQGRIATAHTLDDRAETFFMRVIVGGGGSGLSSIPLVNGRVIRPLLTCTREELREWLQLHSKSSHDPLWREDVSNRDTSRLRAFVRHEFIPLAQTRNPYVAHTIARSLDVLSAEDALLTRLAADLEKRYVCETSGPSGPSGPFDPPERPVLIPTSTTGPSESAASAPSLAIDTALFGEEQALVRRVIRTACKRVMPPTARITFEHIENIVANGRHFGFATDIPGDVTVRNVYGTLVIRQKTAGEKPRHDPRQHSGLRGGTRDGAGSTG
jgi:tRNA(Ile)-lysidine synthase